MRRTKVRLARTVRHLIPVVALAASISVAGSTLRPSAAEAAWPGYNGLLALSARHEPGAEASLWTMRADGSELQRLTRGYQPSWSPDGTRIVFADRNENAGIWVVDADGSNRSQLITGSSWSPTWSPDGSKIAYSNFVERDHGHFDYDIWVMNADGSDPQSLDDAPGSSETSPSWSPDGSRIAFVSDRFDDGDIFVMNASGSNVVRLTSHIAADYFPDWSPDGTRILFTRSWPAGADSGYGFFTMSPDGTGEQLLTELVNPGHSAWSPDGEHVALVGGFSQEVYRVRSDGSAPPVELTSFNFSDTKFVDWQPVATPPAPTGEFTSLTPARILDTRDGTGRGGATSPLGADQAFDVQITGRGGVAVSGVSAVVMNVTVTEPTAASYLTVWPSGLTRPWVSNLNYVADLTVPNLVTVAVGDGGRVSVYNRFGSAHVIFDVVGFYADDSGPSGSRFHAIDPFRYFDTRDGTGGVGVGPVGPDGVLWFNVLGKGGVPWNPGGVTAVVMNVTVTEPTATSYLTVYPSDVTARPLASNLNYLPGVTVPNLVVVRVPQSGVIEFFNRFGTVHVLADVVGYYDDDNFSEAGRFVGVKPSRTFDSRVDFDQPFFEDSGITLGVAGWAGVPPNGAGAAVLNVTATEPTTAGYVTVFPDDLCTIPWASNLNFVPGQTVPNQVVVRLSTPSDCAYPDVSGAIFLYNRFGFVELIVDVFGYFTDASSYTNFVTISDDTGAISVDVPVEWNDIWATPVGDPPEPILAVSTDIDAWFESWDVPAIAIEASRTIAATYPAPFEYLNSLEFDNVAECDTTDTGPYDDGVFVGEFLSADGCGTANAEYFYAVTQQAGTDYYVIIQYQTVTPQDAEAMNRVIASIAVTLP